MVLVNKVLKSTFFLIIILFTSCNPIIYNSYWQAKKLEKVKFYELQEPFRFHDDNSSLQYSVSNDSDNFYILIKTPDLNDQFKILHAGMEIWIDTTGKFKHHTGIIFPNPAGQNNINYSSSKVINKSGINMQKKRFISENEKVRQYGFNAGTEAEFTGKSTSGIIVSIDWDSVNTLYYKATIPFATFYRFKVSQDAADKVLSLSVVLKALSDIKDPDDKSYRQNEESDEESDQSQEHKDNVSDHSNRQNFANGHGSYGVKDASGNNMNNHEFHHQGNGQENEHKSSQNSSPPFEETTFKIKFRLVTQPSQF